MHALFLGHDSYKSIHGPNPSDDHPLLALLAVFFSSLVELAEEGEQRILFLSLISACSPETHPFVLPCQAIELQLLLDLGRFATLSNGWRSGRSQEKDPEKRRD